MGERQGCGQALNYAVARLCSCVEERSIGVRFTCDDSVFSEACRLAALCLGVDEECRTVFEEGPEDPDPVRSHRLEIGCLAECLYGLFRPFSRLGDEALFHKAWSLASRGGKEAVTLYWLCHDIER